MDVRSVVEPDVVGARMMNHASQLVVSRFNKKLRIFVSGADYANSAKSMT